MNVFHRVYLIRKYFEKRDAVKPRAKHLAKAAQKMKKKTSCVRMGTLNTPTFWTILLFRTHSETSIKIR